MTTIVKIQCVDTQDKALKVTLSTDPGKPAILEAGQERTFTLDNITFLTVEEVSRQIEPEETGPDTE